MKKRTQQVSNTWTFIGGKVHGTFHPDFRAEKERRAAAAGMTFDQYMVREHRELLLGLLALT